MNDGASSGPADLLALVLEAARQMSRSDDPLEAAQMGLSYARRILCFDRSIAATRRDMHDGAIRITRSDAPDTPLHDPIGREEFPPLRRGILRDLLYAGQARLFDDLTVARDDPAAGYLHGMRSLAAIPQFRGGEASEMIFHLRRQRAAFRPEQLGELVLITNLFGQSITHLSRARESAQAEQSLKTQYEIIAKLSTNVMNSALDLRHDNELLEQRVRVRTRELAEANLDAIYMLAIASEAKDEETGAHVRRIFRLTQQIATALGHSAREAEELAHAAVLHDVGKIHVPDNILKKPGPLTEEEWTVMRQHTIAGERILADKPFFARARSIARSHHENFDGSGYPDARHGADIPIEARIVHLADVYDALTNPRVYKPAWPRAKALEFIRASSGGMFDPEVVSAFISIKGEEKAGEGTRTLNS